MAVTSAGGSDAGVDPLPRCMTVLADVSPRGDPPHLVVEVR